MSLIGVSVGALARHQAGKDQRVTVETSPVRMSARVSGYVQGVGFRWFVRRVAHDIGLAGRATNLADGTVEVVAEGPRERCQRLVDVLRGGATPGHVDRVTVDWSDPTGLRGFTLD